MIRIISLFLLTFIISSANARPRPVTDTTPGVAIPATVSIEQTEESIASTMSPESVRKFEQLPRMKPWMDQVGVKSAPAPKAKSAAKTQTSKPVGQSAPAIVNSQAPDASSVSAPMSAPATEITFGGTPARAIVDTLATPLPSAAASESPLKVATVGTYSSREPRFLPTRRRIDREINKLKFAYKGEVMMGITASYGTLSSDDAGFLTILTNIDANATIASVKPFLGYFYRDNNCVGVRFGYSHTGGKIDKAIFDLGPSNDTSMDIPYVKLDNNNYSFGIFHRSYAGLDPKGRFGLFAEFELAVSTGSSEFSYKSDGNLHQTFSDNTQVKLAFNPGAAVYIFPNVCATLSFGLGGVQYTSVTQKDAQGNKIGSRKTSNMKFKLNIAAINIGMTIHLWDKKKQ